MTAVPELLVTAVTLHRAGDLPRAEEIYLQILRQEPRHADALHLLGLVYHQTGRYEKSSESIGLALRVKPDFPEAYFNLGTALKGRGKLDEANVHFRQAILLKPTYAEAHYALGNLLRDEGRPEEALACYEEAIRNQPDNAPARLGRALAWLLRGDFERGWPEYEWRWQYTETVPITCPQPTWDGSPLEGRTILLYGEQGLGDMIQFVRYANLVKQRGGTVLMRCPAALHPLLSTCSGIDQLMGNDTSDVPPFDVHAPLLSLPGILGTRLETIPAPVPYLAADATLVERWRHELASVAGYRVGIAWEGFHQGSFRRSRSIPLEALEPLAGIDGVRLISLQKGPRDGAERTTADRLGVIDLGPELDEAAGAFMDTAAVMKGLDLVITIDTSIAHLAGALGVATWVALPIAPDWRWLREREDTPWYPTLRLFRQPARGDWTSVLGRMAAELKERVAGPAPRPPISVEIAPGELIDKITILEIKRNRIADPAKVAHVVTELGALSATRDRSIFPSTDLAGLTAELRSVNEALWEVEDMIRLCERGGDFGPRFIELARSVYRHNDRRAALKAAINERLGAKFREQKFYTADG